MYLEDFLRFNGVDVDGFIEEYATHMLGVYEEYDDRIAKYAVYGDYEEKLVDVKDVLGFPDYLVPERGLLDNICLLFDPHGDNYHSRANGMTKYHSDEVVEKLERSFREEPIKLYGMGGKYFLSSNGNHRLHLLMLHYLMDKFKGVDVTNKYRIPVVVQELDVTKTFANYMGSLLWDEKFTVYNEIGPNGKTGRAEVYYHGEEKILTDNELITFLSDRLDALKGLDDYYYIDVIQSLWVKYRREESGMFKNFINENFPELEHVMQVEEFMDIENEVRNTLLGGVNYGNN